MDNIHKINFKKIQLPTSPLVEVRNKLGCCTRLRKFAEPSDSTTYKNDVSFIFAKCDVLEVVTVFNGVEAPAKGVVINFPNDNEAKGFVIDWRQYQEGGVLQAGCYDVIAKCNLSGFEYQFLHSEIELFKYSIEISEGSIRLNSIFNDWSDFYKINFAGSGGQDTIRVNGFFGKMQPNYNIENIVTTDKSVDKVFVQSTPIFTLKTDLISGVELRNLERLHLLHANLIYISDFNAHNIYDYKEFPVVLNSEDSPQINYLDNTGSNNVKFTCTFNEKIINKKSKFETDFKNETIPQIGLWQGVACGTAKAKVNLNNVPFIQLAPDETKNIALSDFDENTLTNFTTDENKIIIGKNNIIVNFEDEEVYNENLNTFVGNEVTININFII